MANPQVKSVNKQNDEYSDVGLGECHVLAQGDRVNSAAGGLAGADRKASDVCLFTQQELHSMDFSQLLDIEDMDIDYTQTTEGIEAESLNSLLELFEAESTDSSGFEVDAFDQAVSQLANQGLFEENENIKNLPDIDNNNSIKLPGTNSPIPSSKVLEKIRSNSNKRKGAILLPIGACLPSRKEKGAQFNRVTNIDNVNSSDKSNLVLTKDNSSSSNSLNNIQDIISDHDYCSVASDVQTVEQANLDNENPTNINNNNNNNNDISELTISQESKDSGVEEGEILESDLNDDSLESNPAKESVFFPCPHNLKSKRNYRKNNKEPVFIPDGDDSKYYDKIPAYYTTLSLPQKPIKKEQVTSGISITDYIPHDRSPTRDTDSMYSKLPDYYSCFTNSTKYDDQMVDEIEIKIEPTDEFDNEWDRRSRRSRKSSRSTSRSSSSSSCASSCSTCSRSSSRGGSRDRYKRSERRKRRYSYSSSSWSSSRSRSNSRSSVSSSESYNRRRSRSYSRSRGSRRIPRRYRKSRSKSRSRTHYRSRSRHRSRKHRSYTRSRSRSLERNRDDRKKQREEEKERQIDERRIVYVGRIPSDYTKKDLRRRFDRFGEIITVTTHFREYGDNYGFVTFAYTCDAFAAIEKGNAVPGEMKFDLCFGGRRKFCDTEYADLDGKNEDEDMFQTMQPKSSSSDFDELLRQARQKMKK